MEQEVVLLNEAMQEYEEEKERILTQAYEQKEEHDNLQRLYGELQAENFELRSR